MDTQIPVTNEMLYHLIIELKNDMHRRFEDVDRRFEQVDKRFEQVDKRFEQVDKRFEQFGREFDLIREQMREEARKLEKVYEARDRVTVNFTRSWALASLGLAIAASSLVLLFAKNILA